MLTCQFLTIKCYHMGEFWFWCVVTLPISSLGKNKKNLKIKLLCDENVLTIFIKSSTIYVHLYIFLTFIAIKTSKAGQGPREASLTSAKRTL